MFSYYKAGRVNGVLCGVNIGIALWNAVSAEWGLVALSCGAAAFVWWVGNKVARFESGRQL